MKNMKGAVRTFALSLPSLSLLVCVAGAQVSAPDSTYTKSIEQAAATSQAAAAEGDLAKSREQSGLGFGLMVSGAEQPAPVPVTPPSKNGTIVIGGGSETRTRTLAGGLDCIKYGRFISCDKREERTVSAGTDYSTRYRIVDRALYVRSERSKGRKLGGLLGLLAGGALGAMMISMGMKALPGVAMAGGAAAAGSKLFGDSYGSNAQQKPDEFTEVEHSGGHYGG